MSITTSPAHVPNHSHVCAVVTDDWTGTPFAGVIPSVRGAGWDEDRAEVENRLQSLEDRYPYLRRPR